MINDKMRREIIKEFEKHNVGPIVVEIWGAWDWLISFKGTAFRVATGPKTTAEGIVKIALTTLKSLNKI